MNTKPWQTRTIAVYGIALCMAAPALAADTFAERSHAAKWVASVRDEVPQLPEVSPPPFPSMPMPVLQYQRDPVTEAYGNGAIAGSWMTGIVFIGAWFFSRLPLWLEAVVSLWRRKPAP